MSRRAAIRSTIDWRAIPPVADVSGAEDRGVDKLCMPGLSVRVLLFWLPIDLEGPPDEDDSFRGAVNTGPDRERLEGAHRVLKSCAGARLGVGAVNDGVDLLENGLERVVAGGLLGVNEGGAPGATEGREGDIERGTLGVNEGREGVNEGGALGVNDGREGDTERGALGVNDGLEGAAGGGLNDGLEGVMEGDPPEPNGEPWLRDDPKLGLGLGLGLMASRRAPMSRTAALRSEAACARREPNDPINRATVSATDVTAALRFLFSPARNMAVSFPSSGGI